MKISFCLSLIWLLLFQPPFLFSQTGKGDFSILFYNVENLFDAKDGQGRGDDEFTPGGERHWTNKKLDRKLINISKSILNSSGFEMPVIVALCEVENRYVLERLVNDTPLGKSNYTIIHKESPDRRGIDVALLYNADFVFPIGYKFYPLLIQNDTVKTREILYFSGIINGSDTLHVFVNHWPSRYDGVLESEPMRNLAARVLKTKVEGVQARYFNPKIVILGDFNDQPFNKSISEILGAKPVSCTPEGSRLYNLSVPWVKSGVGTLKYRSQWSVFDQCIVSGSLLNSSKGYFVVTGGTKIVSLPFLLKKDERYGGERPFRTYSGYSYEGGFSDHLPILVKLGYN